MFPLLPTAIDNIRAGTLRGLAVTSSARYDELPSLGESLPGYEASVWNGLGAPRSTPDTIVQKLNVEVNAALKDKEFKAKLARLGAAGLGGSPDSVWKTHCRRNRKMGQGHQVCRRQGLTTPTFCSRERGRYT